MKKLAMLTIVLLAVGTVIADDFNPPAWRGGPLSVQAEWNFENGPPQFELIPDGIYNTVGGNNGETLSGYLTHIDYGPGSYYVNDPDGSGPKGAGWYFNAFVIHVANWIDNEPYKDIRVQLTGYTIGGGASTILADPTLMGLNVDRYSTLGQPLDDWAIADWGTSYNDVDDITQTWIDFRLWPNPDNEDIEFNTPLEGVIIDQVYVDTISVPEPATISLMALGALSLLRKRRS